MLIWAGIKTIVGWCSTVVEQARYDWQTINELRKQYKDFNPDEMW